MKLKAEYDANDVSSAIFGPTRHIASRKAMACHRTPQALSRQGQPEISPAHRAGLHRPKYNPS
jgi:hypothetical protein